MPDFILERLLQLDNMIAMVRSVTGTARALHVGSSTQVWEIRIEDERGRLACISRLTLAVVKRS